MERQTKRINEEYYLAKETIIETPDGYSGTPIERLGRWEDAIESIEKEIEELTKQLEEYRKNNQTKSYRFKESLALKSMNQKLLSLFESHYE